MMWENNITMKIDIGENDPALRIGSNSYVNGIESKYPGYLHCLYCYAIKTYGANSGFQLLSTAMNQKIDSPSEERLTIHMRK